MKKIILDCDPGMDDSMAIVMAVKSDILEVEAITTVNGNYPVEVTSANARKILELLNQRSIPVARGMSQPMVRETPEDPFTHGADGQAENFLPEPKIPLAEKHAVEMIIDLVRDHPGEITIICTGPLTNLAMAIRKAPDITEKIDEVIAISGAFGLNEYSYLNATGDSPQSEWNVFVDPDAADIVYNAGINFVAIGLDVAAHSDVDFQDADIGKLQKSLKPEAKFLQKAISFVRSRGYDSYCAVIDCMAVAYAIDPSLLKTLRGRVGVETTGKLTVGNTVLERRLHHAMDSLSEIVIAYEADFGKVLSLIMELVLA